MTIRRRNAEHVFGTLKSRMGYTLFLTQRTSNLGAAMLSNLVADNFSEY